MLSKFVKWLMSLISNQEIFVIIKIKIAQMMGSPKSKILVSKYLARLQRGLIFFGLYGFNFIPHTLRKKYTRPTTLRFPFI